MNLTQVQWIKSLLWICDLIVYGLISRSRHYRWIKDMDMITGHRSYFETMFRAERSQLMKTGWMDHEVK